jgi:hypothetical protein
MRFIKLSDTAERTYDSCLPSYDAMIITNFTSSISNYVVNGENVTQYEVQDPVEKNINISSFQQFPYINNPKREVDYQPAIVDSYSYGTTSPLRFATDPDDLTGVITPNLRSIVYTTRYQVINPDVSSNGQHPIRTMFPYGYGDVLNLQSGLVSSYWLTQSIPTGPLVDYANGNDMDLTPTSFVGTHPTVQGSAFYVPVGTGTNQPSMWFTKTGTRTSVQYAEASGDYDDHKMVDNVTSPTRDLPFTISVTIRTTTAAGSDNQIILERFSTSKREYEIYLDSQLRVAFRIGSTNLSNVKGVKTTSSIVEDEWYHIVAVYDGRGTASATNSMKIYLNGSLASVTSANAGTYSGVMNCDSAARLRLGAHLETDGGPDESSDYDGYIWTVNIWKNRALTSNEIYGLYLSEIVGNYEGYVRHRTGEIDYDSTPLFGLKTGTPKYGISRVTAEFSSSKWRVDHYGYLRDMLEPRQHSATFDGVKPVKIRFTSGSAVILDPSTTHAQNLSTFATSSMPFFDDGIARNRDDNPDETLLSV